MHHGAMSLSHYDNPMMKTMIDEMYLFESMFDDDDDEKYIAHFYQKAIRDNTFFESVLGYFFHDVYMFFKANTISFSAQMSIGFECPVCILDYHCINESGSIQRTEQQLNVQYMKTLLRNNCSLIVMRLREWADQDPGFTAEVIQQDSYDVYVFNLLHVIRTCFADVEHCVGGKKSLFPNDVEFYWQSFISRLEYRNGFVIDKTSGIQTVRAELDNYLHDDGRFSSKRTYSSDTRKRKFPFDNMIINHDNDRSIDSSSDDDGGVLPISMIQHPNDTTQLEYDGNPNSLLAVIREYANNQTECFTALCGFRINNASCDVDDELYNEGAYEGQGWWKYGTMRGWFVRVQEMPERYVFSGVLCNSDGKLLADGDTSGIYAKIVSDIIEIADANGPNETGEINVDSKGNLVLHIWDDEYNKKKKIGKASGDIITFPISQSIDSVNNALNEDYNLVVVPYAFTNSLDTHFEDEDYRFNEPQIMEEQSKLPWTVNGPLWLNARKDAENSFTKKLESRYDLIQMLDQHSHKKRRGH